MSLSLGQSESYINKIENVRTMPSIQVFFYICDYFNITPAFFFDEEVNTSFVLNELVDNLSKLDDDILNHLLQIVKAMNMHNQNNH